MKKLEFNVSNKEEGSVVSLIREVNNVPCRIQIDLENKVIAVENMTDNKVDSVVDLIDDFFTISNITIDNTSDEKALVENSQNVTVTQESKAEADFEENVEAKSNLTVVEPQSEEDLIIQKVEFENEFVEDVINRLLRTAYWAMYKKNASEKEIVDFIWNSINEISMKNNPTIIDYSVGDIVECNYGYHLRGEVSGGRVFALVCRKLESGMVFLVPIFKIKKNLYTSSCLSFDVPNDIMYDDYHSNNGVILLDKGRYVNEERVISVIGSATPEFMAKVFDKLSTTFDFRDNAVMDDDAKTDFDNEEGEAPEGIAESKTNVAMDNEKATDCDAVDADTSDVTKTKTKKTVKKKCSEQASLLDIVGGALEKIDPTKPIDEQASDFLADIGMETSGNFVNRAFVISAYINKICYENVVSELNYMFPEVNEHKIKSILQKSFKNWLKSYPELVESCPKISLISLLKVFAKRFASNKPQNN